MMVPNLIERMNLIIEFDEFENCEYFFKSLTQILKEVYT